jgi:hypothetical protein
VAGVREVWFFLEKDQDNDLSRVRFGLHPWRNCFTAQGGTVGIHKASRRGGMLVIA